MEKGGSDANEVYNTDSVGEMWCQLVSFSLSLSVLRCNGNVFIILYIHIQLLAGKGRPKNHTHKSQEHG